MSDERPIDLRALDATEPEVLKASIRRFRRRVLTWVAWGLVFAAAASAIVVATIRDRQGSVEARIAGVPALNSMIGDYRVGGVDIGLLKVVRFSGDEVGLQFVFHSVDPLGHCCNLYPREALPGTTLQMGSAHFGELLVVLPESYVARDGTLDMLLTDGEGGRLGRFTVDLHALHVAGIGGSG